MAQRYVSPAAIRCRPDPGFPQSVAVLSAPGMKSPRAKVSPFSNSVCGRDTYPTPAGAQAALDKQRRRKERRCYA